MACLFDLRGALVALVVMAGVCAPALAQNPRPPSEWLAYGSDLLAQGKTAKAVLVFGQLAARLPDYPPARDGLERSFAHFGSPRRSAGFLRYALAEDQTHKTALLHAWQLLDRAHPLRFSASAEIMPSSNIDRASSERYLVTDFGTFLIDKGGAARAGTGLGYGVTLDWFIHPRPGHRFRLRATYAGAWFKTATLRYREPALTLQYENLRAPAPWALEAYLRKRDYGGSEAESNSDSITRGLRFSKTWRRGPADRIVLRLEGQQQRYRDLDTSPLSGPRYSLDIARRQPLGAQGRLRYGLHLERALPENPIQRYRGLELRIGYDRPLFEGLRAGISLGLGGRFYDSDFTYMSAKRRDRSLRIGLSAELSRMRILGQVPRIGCTARRTYSNVALYSFRSLDCNMALSMTF